MNALSSRAFTMFISEVNKTYNMFVALSQSGEKFADVYKERALVLGEFIKRFNALYDGVFRGDEKAIGKVLKAYEEEINRPLSIDVENFNRRVDK